MDKLCIFYLYLGDLAKGVNASHLARIKTAAPDAAVIPLSFKTSPEINRYYLDEKKSWDLLVWDYYRRNRMRYNRYLVLDSDTLVTQHPREFLRQVWNQAVVGATIIDPNSSEIINPLETKAQKDWFWFHDGIEAAAVYNEHKHEMLGIMPLFMLLSQAAIKAMTAKQATTPWVAKMNGECRAGTLAKLCGFKPVSFSPTAHTRIWYGNVTPTGPGIWHKVVD